MSGRPGMNGHPGGDAPSGAGGPGGAAAGGPGGPGGPGALPPLAARRDRRCDAAASGAARPAWAP